MLEDWKSPGASVFCGGPAGLGLCVVRKGGVAFFCVSCVREVGYGNGSPGGED